MCKSKDDDEEGEEYHLFLTRKGLLHVKIMVQVATIYGHIQRLLFFQGGSECSKIRIVGNNISFKDKKQQGTQCAAVEHHLSHYSYLFILYAYSHFHYRIVTYI